MKIPLFKKRFGLIDLVIVVVSFYALPMLIESLSGGELLLPRGTKIQVGETPTLFWVLFVFYTGGILFCIYGLFFYQMAGDKVNEYDHSGNRSRDS